MRSITTVAHLQYLVEHGFRWDEHTITELIKHNYLDSIIYLHKQGCPLAKDILQYGYTRHLECLQYLREHGCDWNPNVFIYAVLRGNYDILKFAHEHGCPLPDVTFCIGCDWIGTNRIFVKLCEERCSSGVNSTEQNLSPTGFDSHEITSNVQMCLDYVNANKLFVVQHAE
jgi:hypothetical protein